MNAAVTYTLPTMQLVCYLVVPGQSNISNTIPPSIQPRFPSATPTTPELPPGYVAYPDFGMAYKVHNELVSWDVAKDRCAREGAYLAAMDSFDKIQVVRSQNPSKNLTHVGFHLLDSDTTWYSVHNGLPIGTLPWASSEPSGGGRCAVIKYGTGGLGKYSCTISGDYVCQIQYPARDRPINITHN